MIKKIAKYIKGILPTLFLGLLIFGAYKIFEYDKIFYIILIVFLSGIFIGRRSAYYTGLWGSNYNIDLLMLEIIIWVVINFMFMIIFIVAEKYDDKKYQECLYSKKCGANVKCINECVNDLFMINNEK